MTPYDKLVRDGIPDKLDKRGIFYEKRIANDAEYKDELVKKLVEEANEFAEARSTEELADVMEVVEALKTLKEYENAEEARKTKKIERGGFEKRFILKGEK